MAGFYWSFPARRLVALYRATRATRRAICERRIAPASWYQTHFRNGSLSDRGTVICIVCDFYWAIFPLFLQYSVVLFSFDSPGLDLGNAEFLLEQPVDIVTAFAPGPRARMYAPPGYESEMPVQEVTNVRSLSDLGFFWSYINKYAGSSLFRPDCWIAAQAPGLSNSRYQSL